MHYLQMNRSKSFLKHWQINCSNICVSPTVSVCLCSKRMQSFSQRLPIGTKKFGKRISPNNDDYLNYNLLHVYVTRGTNRVCTFWRSFTSSQISRIFHSFHLLVVDNPNGLVSTLVILLRNVLSLCFNFGCQYTFYSKALAKIKVSNRASV
jgi:hypothetical protein